MGKLKVLGALADFKINKTDKYVNKKYKNGKLNETVGYKLVLREKK